MARRKRNDDKHHDLTRRERQIMDVIYQRGEATVNDIRDAMPDPPSHTAVRTFLRILEEKGHVTRRAHGRAHIYKPKAQRQNAGRTALERVIRTFFDGSLSQAVAAHMADGRADLTDEEIKRLSRLVREARKRGN
jgi:predicted transcriptional regulator